VCRTGLVDLAIQSRLLVGCMHVQQQNSVCLLYFFM
jgi:hypothetical protein